MRAPTLEPRFKIREPYKYVLGDHKGMDVVDTHSPEKKRVCSCKFYHGTYEDKPAVFIEHISADESTAIPNLEEAIVSRLGRLNPTHEILSHPNTQITGTTRNYRGNVDLITEHTPYKWQTRIGFAWTKYGSKTIPWMILPADKRASLGIPILSAQEKKSPKRFREWEIREKHRKKTIEKMRKTVWR